MTNPTIVAPVKMEYGWNFSISGLNMIVKSGLEKILQDVIYIFFPVNSGSGLAQPDVKMELGLPTLPRTPSPTQPKNRIWFNDFNSHWRSSCSKSQNSGEIQPSFDEIQPSLGKIQPTSTRMFCHQVNNNFITFYIWNIWILKYVFEIIKYSWFSYCLWRGNSMLMYCDLWPKSSKNSRPVYCSRLYGSEFMPPYFFADSLALGGWGHYPEYHPQYDYYPNAANVARGPYVGFDEKLGRNQPKSSSTRSYTSKNIARGRNQWKMSVLSKLRRIQAW